MAMLNDRMPKRAVDIDEHNDAEEMEVVLSPYEIRLTQPDVDWAKCADAEPWLRIRHGDALYISAGVTEIVDTEDGA